MNSSSKKLLIIFDIDETLINYVGPQSYHYWERVSLQNKTKLKDKCKVHDDRDNRNLIVYRPGIKNLFDFIIANKKYIDVALWTYASRLYSKMNANLISKDFQLEIPFLFTYGRQDMEQEYYPKALSEIWKKYPKIYDNTNTIIIDDRVSNLNHSINRYNSIQISPFAPFGTKNPRSNLNEISMQQSIEDNSLFKVVEVLKLILKNHNYNSPIFLPNNVSAFGLNLNQYKLPYIKHKYLDSYNMKEVKEVKEVIYGGKRTRKNSKIKKKRLKKTNKISKQNNQNKKLRKNFLEGRRQQLAFIWSKNILI